MRRRGFSLLECLISLMLVLMVLGMLAALAKDYATQAQSPEDRVLKVQLALLAAASELEQCCQLVTPSSGTDSKLVFSKIDPSRNGDPAGPSDRLPLPNPYINPLPSFNPLDPNDQVTITFEVNNRELTRLASDTLGNTIQQPVAQEVEGFSATLVNPRIVRLSLSLRQPSGLVLDYQLSSFLQAVQ